MLAGLLLLTLGNFADISGGPKMELVGSKMFNLEQPMEAARNFVPFYAPGGNEMAEAMQASLDGGDVMVGAVAVPVVPGQLDQFTGCAQSQMSGGDELLDMSDFLLNPEGGGADEGGATRYGAIVVHPTSLVDLVDPTAPATLAYNVLVNTTAVHAAPIYMNLANQAALQYITTNPAAVIAANSHPLPLTQQQRQFASAGDAFTGECIIWASDCRRGAGAGQGG